MPEKSVADSSVLISYSSIYFVLHSAAEACLIPFLPLFFRQLGLSALQVGIIFAVRAFLSAIFSPLWCFFATKFEKQKVLLLFCAFGAISFSFVLIFVPPTTHFIPNEKCENNNFGIALSHNSSNLVPTVLSFSNFTSTTIDEFSPSYATSSQSDNEVTTIDPHTFNEEIMFTKNTVTKQKILAYTEKRKSVYVTERPFEPELSTLKEIISEKSLRNKAETGKAVTLKLGTSNPVFSGEESKEHNVNHVPESGETAINRRKLVANTERNIVSTDGDYGAVDSEVDDRMADGEKNSENQGNVVNIQFDHFAHVNRVESTTEIMQGNMRNLEEDIEEPGDSSQQSDLSSLSDQKPEDNTQKSDQGSLRGHKQINSIDSRNQFTHEYESGGIYNNIKTEHKQKNHEKHMIDHAQSRNTNEYNRNHIRRLDQARRRRRSEQKDDDIEFPLRENRPLRGSTTRIIGNIDMKEFKRMPETDTDEDLKITTLDYTSHTNSEGVEALPELPEAFNSNKGHEPTGKNVADFEMSKMEEDDFWSLTFILSLSVVMFGAMTTSPGPRLVENSLYHFLEHEDKLDQYSCTIIPSFAAYSSMALIATAVIDHLPCHMLGSQSLMNIHIYVFIIIMILTSVVSSFVPLFTSYSSHTTNKMKKALQLLSTDTQTVFLTLSCILQGFLSSSTPLFIFWMLQDLGGSELSMGTFLALSSFSKLLMTILSTEIIHKISHLRVICLSFLCLSFSNVFYCIISNPLLVLPLALLDGLIHQSFWESIFEYLEQTAPPGLSRKMLTHLQTLNLVVGVLCGSLFSGILYDVIGLNFVFLILGGVSLVWTVLLIIIMHACPQQDALHYSKLFQGNKLGETESDDDYAEDWLVEALQEDEC